MAGDRITWLGMMQALRDRGHDVTLVTGFRETRRDFGMAYNIVYVRSPRTRGLKHLATVAGAVRAGLRDIAERRTDAVICDAATVLLLGPALRLRRLRNGLLPRPVLVLDVRTMPVHSTGLEMRSKCIFRAGMAVGATTSDAVTAISEPMLSHLRATTGIPAHLASGIWTSGVDTTMFNPGAVSSSQVTSVRAALGVGERITFVHHGTISRSRGLEDLVRAIATLPTETRRQLALLVVGGGRDLNYLQRAVATRGLSDTVIFTGVGRALRDSHLAGSLRCRHPSVSRHARLACEQPHQVVRVPRDGKARCRVKNRGPYDAPGRCRMCNIC